MTYFGVVKQLGDSSVVPGESSSPAAFLLRVAEKSGYFWQFRRRRCAMLGAGVAGAPEVTATGAGVSPVRKSFTVGGSPSACFRSTLTCHIWRSLRCSLNPACRHADAAFYLDVGLPGSSSVTPTPRNNCGGLGNMPSAAIVFGSPGRPWQKAHWSLYTFAPARKFGSSAPLADSGAVAGRGTRAARRANFLSSGISGEFVLRARARKKIKVDSGHHQHNSQHRSPTQLPSTFRLPLNLMWCHSTRCPACFAR